MNRVPAAAALFLSAAIGFTSAVQAMEIPQFDRMAQNDRAGYVSELVSGAEKILTNEGKADQARKVESLFTTNAPDGATSIGMSQFMLDLAKARLADAQRALKDPNAQRLYGRIAKARAGKPNPCSTFGQVTTITAPVAGTLSRFVIASI